MSTVSSSTRNARQICVPVLAGAHPHRRPKWVWMTCVAQLLLVLSGLLGSALSGCPMPCCHDDDGDHDPLLHVSADQRSMSSNHHHACTSLTCAGGGVFVCAMPPQFPPPDEPGALTVLWVQQCCGVLPTSIFRPPIDYVHTL